MDPPTELPQHGAHEELALNKINWLPGGVRKRCWVRADQRNHREQVGIKRQDKLNRVSTKLKITESGHYQLRGNIR